MMDDAKIIELLANQDLMPGADVLGDFYQTEKITPSLQDQWEPIDEHLLGDIEVPGYPDICPYRAWNVTTQRGEWRVYMWYEGNGRDDDAYLYCEE